MIKWIGSPILWIPVRPRWVQEHSGHIEGAEGMHGLNNKTGTHQSQPDDSHCWVPNCQQQIPPRHWALIWHHSSRWKFSYLMSGWLHYIEVTLYSYLFAFHACNTSARTTIHGLKWCLTLLCYFASLAESWLIHYVNFNSFFIFTWKATIPICLFHDI